MFDILGNYLYCSTCIRVAFEISKDRLTRRQNIKRLQSQVPISEMTKSEIEQQCLSDFVIMPQHLDISFNKWWRSVPSSSIGLLKILNNAHLIMMSLWRLSM